MKRKTVDDKAKEASRLQSRQRSSLRRKQRQKAAKAAEIAHDRTVHNQRQSEAISVMDSLRPLSVIFQPPGGRPK